jgi:ABC-type branched-subunit amino acid transport system substrate-binding protein
MLSKISIASNLSVNTYDNKCRIGYGYSDVLLSIERQEHFFMGFKYGLEKGFQQLAGKESGPCNTFDKIEIIKVERLGMNKLDAFYAAQELASKNIIMMAGFPTSHEALLAARVAKEHQLALIVPGAGNNALEEFSSYLFTTSAKNIDYIVQQFDELVKKYPKKNILVLAKKDAVFSMDILENIVKLNNSAGKPISIKPMYLLDNLQLDQSELQSEIEKGVASVFITMYASESKQAFSQILELIPKGTTIYVSSAWPFGDVSHLFDLKSKYENPIRSVAAWSETIGKNKKDSFYKKYQQTFKTHPPVEAGHGYEAGYFAAYVLFHSKKADSASVLEALHNTKCLTVDTVGDVCRDSTGFSKRNLFWMNWTMQGFESEGTPNAF